MPFYKRKSLYIILIIILLVVGGVVYGKYKKANTPVSYETIKVKKGNLRRTVEATGKVQSTNDLSLRFETSGTISSIKVYEGQIAKKGQILATLNLAQLGAAVSQAQANLNQQLAGSTDEELNSLKAAVDSAKANWDKSKADANSTIAIAESTVTNATNNLKLAEGGSSSKIVTDEYKDAVAVLQKSLSVINNALTEADKILGVDDTLANNDYDEYLSAKDSGKLNIAINYYPIVKNSKIIVSNLVLPLTTVSSQESIDKALNATEDALSEMNQLLAYTTDVLDATVAIGSFTQSALDVLKSGISTERTAVTTQYTAIITQKQDISSAKTSYTTFKIAYDKAVKDLEITKQQATATMGIYEASYNQALANYKNKKNPPREVDVASYRAALSQAIANRDKAIIYAPMDGKIAKINKKVGEYISASEDMFDMLAPNYEIEVDIPETDVSKLKPLNRVTFTLDALSDDKEFVSQIGNVESKSTEIQDVVYYRVKFSVMQNDINKYGDVVKSGMTANVKIETAWGDEFEDALYLPLRSILTNTDGSKYVRVLRNNELINTDVQLGSRVDNGQVIIKSGVEEGDEIVLSIKK